jgi:hypothetical protein
MPNSLPGACSARSLLQRNTHYLTVTRQSSMQQQILPVVSSGDQIHQIASHVLQSTLDSSPVSHGASSAGFIFVSLVLLLLGVQTRQSARQTNVAECEDAIVGKYYC